MLQIGTSKEQYVIDIRGYTMKELEPVVSALARPDLLVVGHNVTFD